MRTKTGQKRGSGSQAAKKLRDAGIVGGIGRRKGEWERVPRPEAKRIPGKPKDKPKGIKGMNHKHATGFSTATLIEMAKDRASGMTQKEVADKYSVSVSYVNDAMQTLFVSSNVGREILKGVLLDNAISAGMRVRKTVEELSPMQSVIATGVMTQRFIDLEKHTQNAPPDVDFSELAQMGAMLRNIRESVGLDDDTHGDVIDIEAEAQTE